MQKFVAAVLIIAAIAGGATAQYTNILDYINSYTANATNVWNTLAVDSQEGCEFVKYITEKGNLVYQDLQNNTYMDSELDSLLTQAGYTLQQFTDAVGALYGDIEGVLNLTCTSYQSNGPLDLLILYDNYFGNEGTYWTIYYTLRNDTYISQIPQPTSAQLEEIYCNTNMQLVAEATYDAGLDFFSYIFAMMFFFLDLSSVIIC